MAVPTHRVSVVGPPTLGASTVADRASLRLTAAGNGTGPAYRRILAAVPSWQVVFSSLVLLATAAILWTNDDPRRFAAIAQVMASLITVTFGPAALNRVGRSAQSGGRWLLAGSWLWLAADGYELFRIATGASSGGRLFHLVAEVILVIGGVLLLGARQRISSARGVVDGAMIGIVATFVVFAGLAGAPVERAWIGPFIIAALAGGTMVGALLVVTKNVRVRRRVWMLLALAAVLLFVMDLLFWRACLRGESVSAAVSWGWALVSLLRGAVAIEMVFGSRRLAAVGRLPRRVARMLPVFALVIGLGALYLTPGRVSTWICTVMVLALMACVVVRHVLRELEQTALATQVRRVTAELSQRADHDDLTGLLRREPGFARLQQAILDRRRDRGLLSVVFVDVDGFKAINDQFGHVTGDQLLVAIGDRLLAGAAPEDCIVRFGGDEFVLIRPLLKAGEEHWGEQIRLAIMEPLDVCGIPMRVTASIGVVIADGMTGSAGELLKQADHAAYRAKRAGRNQLSGLDMRRPAIVDSNLKQAAEVITALANGQLCIWYQPIVDLNTDRMIGAEALVRWVSPTGQVRSAADFVPDLIAAGYGAELTTLVLHQGCQDFAGGLAAEHGWILSVNVTAKDLLDPQLVDRLATELRTTGMSPDRLQIEIDEHTDPSGPISRVLERISELGIRIALDDFGASSSTFGQIAVLAPTTLKLDKGLLEAITAASASGADLRPAQQSVVGAFASLAHHLAMSVVAEGVESLEQRDLLLRLGCDYGQGFLWSQAVPFERLSIVAGSGFLPLNRATFV